MLNLIDVVTSLPLSALLLSIGCLTLVLLVLLFLLALFPAMGTIIVEIIQAIRAQPPSPSTRRHSHRSAKRQK